MINKCPLCKGKIHISEITCEECGAKVIKDFPISGKASIDDDIWEFIKVFIYAEGSIKKVESILNCSYPKVKKLLKETKENLGLSEESNETKDEILNKLDSGEISYNEALKKLEEL